MSEIKSLRKIEFPDSIIEALRTLERFGKGSASAPKEQQLRTINEILEEFIFFEVDRRGNRRKVTPMKELQVLEKLISYFTDPKRDSQEVFLSLFNMKSLKKTSMNLRLSILTKVVSIAVADANALVLNLVGMWMQTTNCHSSPALHLTEVMIKDYFLLMPSLVESLQSLPLVSSLFCANFICSLTGLYKSQLGSLPPDLIMDLVLKWLGLSYALSWSPLEVVFDNQKIPHTPIPGLIEWCIFSPLLRNFAEDKRFSQLHLTLLETILYVSLSKSETLQRVKHLVMTQKQLLEIIVKLSQLSPHDKLSLALERLAQILQTLLATSCLSFSVELAQSLKTLPTNKLLLTVCKHWKLD